MKFIIASFLIFNFSVGYPQTSGTTGTMGATTSGTSGTIGNTTSGTSGTIGNTTSGTSGTLGNATSGSTGTASAPATGTMGNTAPGANPGNTNSESWNYNTGTCTTATGKTISSTHSDFAQCLKARYRK